MDLPPVPPNRRRPSHADLRAFEDLQATALERALADARVWRNGYAVLGSGIGALLALVGARLDNDTPWPWRLALMVALGGGLILVASALWMTLTVEGGTKRTSLNLGRIVQQHNSFELYEADQAARALARIDRSKKWAVAGAALCFVGLLCTLWMTSPPSDAEPPQPQASISPSTASVTPRPSASATARTTPVPIPSTSATSETSPDPTMTTPATPYPR